MRDVPQRANNFGACALNPGVPPTRAFGAGKDRSDWRRETTRGGDAIVIGEDWRFLISRAKCLGVVFIYLRFYTYGK